MELKNLVGQEAVKRKLQFFADGYQKTHVLPHLMFVSEKGCGKTSFARAVASSLGKPYREINCATLKNVKDFLANCAQFFQEFSFSTFRELNYGSDPSEEVTLIFDEASELPEKVTMLLLSVLNPNSENKNVVQANDRRYVVDFSKVTFMFATTEPQKVFHALMDRCERVDLQPYTDEDLARIICAKVKVESEVRQEICAVLRDNPRSAHKMAENIRAYMESNEIKRFGTHHWRDLRFTLGILPLGVTATELQILKLLGDGTQRLTHLAAKLGMTASAIQRHHENFLIRRGLIKIESNGRALTDRGQKILKEYVET